MFNKARGRRAKHVPGQMNTLERQYAEHLDFLKMMGELQLWRFESVKLRISEKCFYTPDFLVMNQDGFIELHEVKGYWEGDARVKVKAASEMYPEFTFVAVMHDRKTKNWSYERFLD